MAAAEGHGTGEVVEIEAAAVAVAAKTKGRPEPPVAGATTPTMEGTPPGALDTPPTLLPAAVTTSIGGEPKVGSAWPHCHVLGKTGFQPSLQNKIETLTNST